MFGYSEVQEDVEAGHGEVVEEAQEVDEEGERRGDSGDRAGDVGGDSEGAVNDGHEGLLLPGRVERDVELTLQVAAGQLHNDVVLLDDVVVASEEIILAVSVHATGGGHRDGVLDAGG